MAWVDSDIEAEDARGNKVKFRHQQTRGAGLTWEASVTSAGVSTRRYESSYQGALILLLNDLARDGGG